MTMHSIDEQLCQIERRANALRDRRTVRRRRLAQAAAVVACLAVVVCVSQVIARVPGAPGSMGNAPFGSLISSGAAMGYVVVGLIGFFLGIVATAFCRALRRKSADSRRERDPHGGRDAGHV